MLNLILGAAAGFVGGFVAKGQSVKSESLSDNGVAYTVLYNESQAELSKIKAELRMRSSEIDELNQRIKTLTRKLRDNEDDADDKADDIADMRRTIDTLRRQNESLEEKVNDYKSLYTAAQQEIERLKA